MPSQVTPCTKLPEPFLFRGSPKTRGVSAPSTQFCPYFIYFGISKEPENLSEGLIFQADPSGDAGTPLENSSSSTGSREAEQIARRFSASIDCEIKKKRGKKGKGEKITRNYTGREEDSSSTCSSYRVLVPPPCPRHPSVPGGARLAPWETTPRARPRPGKQTQQKEERGKKKGKKKQARRRAS